MIGYRETARGRGSVIAIDEVGRDNEAVRVARRID
jgi:hypothetical protein